MRDLVLVCIAAAVGFAGVWIFSQTDRGSSPLARATAGLGSSCNIKGNVSVNNGDRIYHLPGQRYYAETRIDGRFGERWFCSEADALAAGWGRSRV